MYTILYQYGNGTHTHLGTLRTYKSGPDSRTAHHNESKARTDQRAPDASIRLHSTQVVIGIVIGYRLNTN